MDREHVTIKGATGVDLELPIAGPGSRSYAFVIDWHIRVLVAVAWWVAGMFILGGGLTWRSLSGKSGAASAFFVTLPAIAIYFLYHPLLETLMRGQTPGKRGAGIRVVTREGGIPGVGAILIRNVFRLIDSLPALYVVGLVTTFVSAQRLRIGDMAAGTLLVIDESVTPRIFTVIGAADTQADADLVTTDLVLQILERWPKLAIEKRDAIARSLLTRIGGADGAGHIAALTDDGLKAALDSFAQASSSR
jgi:uncharacterized RDD family membrane protein YckC